MFLLFSKAAMKPGDSLRPCFPQALPRRMAERRAHMRTRVRLILVLVEHVKVGPCTQFRGTRDGSLRSAWRRSQIVIQFLYVRPEESKHGSLLDRDLLREGRGQREALGIGEHGQTHARISARRLNQCLPVCQQAPLLRIRDHVRGHSIFHRAKRIEPLQLRVHPRVVEGNGAIESEQRLYVCVVCV